MNDLHDRLRALTPPQRERLARRLGLGPGPKAAHLVAYVVPSPGASVAPAALRDTLRARLPEYMVPSAVVVLDALTRTPNGKIDRNALPMPEATDRSADTAGYAPPSTTIEAALLAIWSDALGFDRIGVDDSFFEIGGDSILSIQIMARSAEAGLQITSSDFFEHPTIRGLALALERKGLESTESFLVPLAPEGDRPPLFIVHGWGGKVFMYQALARQMGADQPVYGIQDLDYDDPSERFASFEAMVDRYVEEIRALQPHGPYALLGFSVGGTIAYAIASRLHDAGETVERLFVLDTVPYNLPGHVHVRMMLPHMLMRLRHHVRSFVRNPSSVWASRRRLARAFRTKVSPRPVEAERPCPEAADGPDVNFHTVLVRDFVPEPCPLPVTLILATAVKEPYNFRVAWRYLTGGPPDVVQIPFDHHSFLAGEARDRIAAVVGERLGRGGSGSARVA